MVTSCLHHSLFTYVCFISSVACMTTRSNFIELGLSLYFIIRKLKSFSCIYIHICSAFCSTISFEVRRQTSQHCTQNRKVRAIHFTRTRLYVTLGYLLLQIPLSVACRLSVVCNVRTPYSAGWNFRQYFQPFCTLAIRWPPCKVLLRSSQLNPLHRGLNARGVAKYSDVRHV